MANYELPVAAVVPGDPGALRAAARALEQAATGIGAEAVGQVQAAHGATADSWTGAAGEAFGAATADARARLGGFIESLPHLSPVLMAYAEVLERLQREYVEVQSAWRELAAYIRDTPPDTAQADLAGRRYFEAQARLDAIVAAAEASSAQASAQVQAWIDAVSDSDAAGARIALTVSSGEVGAGLMGAQHVAENVLGPGTVSAAYRVAGRGLGPITAGLSRAIEDEANPNYSTAERLGRASGQAVFNGVPSTAAGIVGGVVGGAISGALGPAGTAVGAIAAATGAAYWVDQRMSEIPIQDDVVDASGEAADTVADTVADTLGLE